jgi:RES domain-containing protein
VRLNRLRVLDLRDPEVRSALHVDVDALTSDDLKRCQELAAAARAAGFDGVLGPSAALAGETTIAVFAPAVHKLVPEHSRIQRPPRRMGFVAPRIRRR